MIDKWRLSVLLFLLLLSNAAFSSVCKQLFSQLDKREVSTSDKDYKQKFISLEQDLFAAIEKCKNHTGMFVLMGELQIEMGQIPLAKVYGQKSVEMDDEYWRAHKLLGSARMLNKEYESGLRSLKKAIALNPENINTQLNLISALIHNEKHDQALTRINSIIDNNEQDHLAVAYYFRSQVYKAKGLNKKAKKDEETARDMGFNMEQR